MKAVRVQLAILVTSTRAALLLVVSFLGENTGVRGLPTFFLLRILYSAAEERMTTVAEKVKFLPPNRSPKSGVLPGSAERSEGNRFPMCNLKPEAMLKGMYF